MRSESLSRSKKTPPNIAACIVLVVTTMTSVGPALAKDPPKKTSKDMTLRELEKVIRTVGSDVLRDRFGDSLVVRGKSPFVAQIRRRIAAAKRVKARWILVETLSADSGSHRFVLLVWKPKAKSITLATNRTSKSFRRRHEELFRKGSRDRFIFEYEFAVSAPAKRLFEALGAKEVPHGAWGETSTLGGSTRVLSTGGFPAKTLALLHGLRFSVDTKRLKQPTGPEKPAYRAVHDVYALWSQALGGKAEPDARYEVAASRPRD
jgi:hypothetical protein